MYSEKMNDPDMAASPEWSARSTKQLNPWLTIWFQPRRTMHYIFATDRNKHVAILAMLWGISYALESASNNAYGDAYPSGYIFAMVVLIGPLGGILGLYIYGALLRWTGSWLGGTATGEKVRSAYAWSRIPQIAGLVLWPPAMLLFGRELFTFETPRIESNPLLSLLILAFVFANIALAIWSFVLSLHTIAEAHGFSAWKALGASILTFFVVLGIALLIALPFILLALLGG
jgi:hypothetical protein